MDKLPAPPCFESSVLQNLRGVQHGFFGRAGGVSRGLYESLNAGVGSQDDPAAVRQNRARIAQAMGVSAERLVGVHQVHSAIAVRAEGPWAGPRPEADALVTTTRGLALAVLAADCTPALFADAEAGVIGAAHAGWKGALGGVLEACVAKMERAGARREKIVAAIGPCIGVESYEVGPEYRERFADDDAENARFFRPGAVGKFQFDLKAYAAARLARLGLAAVDVLPHDTCALERDFFSNRRAFLRGEGDYGRNCSAIVLNP